MACEELEAASREYEEILRRADRCKKVEAELATLKKSFANAMKQIDELMGAKDEYAMAEENDRLRKELEWYGDRVAKLDDTSIAKIPYDRAAEDNLSELLLDGGKRARDALAEKPSDG